MARDRGRHPSGPARARLTDTTPSRAALASWNVAGWGSWPEPAEHRPDPPGRLGGQEPGHTDGKPDRDPPPQRYGSGTVDASGTLTAAAVKASVRESRSRRPQVDQAGSLKVLDELRNVAGCVFDVNFILGGQCPRRLLAS